ncbi:S-layer homology domain-containing protein [Ornithinibacillus scapharcae]|uniref:S-layer homology domain-containing protein n=1 Tax=Ornithinibacillus scapharcae TaxID=1147159 RepID=UPI000225B9CC|nr:S-layer homology domain-containing protein [Ornithinibacillus scapharcae]
MAKSHKLVKTSAAVLVASTVVPAAVSAATLNDINSVPAYAKDAVQKLADENYLVGDENGNFKPGNIVDRAQAAEVLRKALNLPVEGTEDFSDVSSNNWFYNAVVATSPELFEGTGNGKFNPTGALTREQAAKVIVNGFGLTGETSLDFSDAKDASSWAKAELEVAVANGIIEGKQSNGKTLLAPQAQITRAEFAVMVDRAIEAAAATEFVVESVEATNGRELVIEFSQAVDETDAKDLSNYTIEGVDFTGATAEVSEDEKTVTITLAAGNEIDVKNAAVVIDEIVSKEDADVKTAKFISLMTYTDAAAPTVANVKAEGTEAVISFDEIIASEGTVSLNGAQISTVVGSTPYYEVSGKTLTIKNLTEEESYKIDIVGAEDSSGNLSNPITLNFTVAKADVDEAKPTVATSVSQNKLTLSFSEAVDPGTVTIAGTPVAAGKVVASDDKKTYTVDVQDANLFNGTTFFSGEVVVNGFKDAAQNAMDEVKFDATFTADTTAPKFLSATVKAGASDDVLLLTFDDAVTSGDLTAVANELVIKTKDGIRQTTGNIIDLTASNVAFGYDLDGKDSIKGNEKNVVAITLTGLVDESSYEFELDGSSVEDVYGNAVADTIDFSVVVPEFVAAEADPTAVVTISSQSLAADNRTINVQFNKQMSDSAKTLSNYKLGGKALPAGTEINFVNDRANVEIILPAGSITANGAQQLEVTGLVDVDGNTLVDGKVVKTISLTENVAPTAGTISVVSSKSFTVNFSEAVANNASVTGVTVKIAGDDVTSASTIEVVNGKLVVTTTENFAPTDSISVEFKDTNIVDANGNKVVNKTVSK